MTIAFLARLSRVLAGPSPEAATSVPAAPAPCACPQPRSNATPRAFDADVVVLAPPPSPRAPAPVVAPQAATTGAESGTVKWFNPVKGYGFITRSRGPDLFVHIDAVKQAGLSTLIEGQAIQFEIINVRGKTWAANLRLV